MSALLTVENLTVHYGAIQALKGISFSVNEGEVIAANGFGKAKTFLQMISTGLVFFFLAVMEKDGEVVITTNGFNAPDWMFIFCTVAFWIVGVITLLSGLKYAKDGWHLIKSK